MDLTMIVLNLDWLLPISAIVTASIGRLNSDFSIALRMSSVGFRIPSIALSDTAGATYKISTDKGFSMSFKCIVSGIRKIRAGSAGTAGSIWNWFSTDKALSRSAKGFHSCLVIALSRTQYTCAPRPDWMMVGLGKPVVLQNWRNATSPSSSVAYGLSSPQSKSIKKDFSSSALVAYRPWSAEPNLASAKNAL